MGERYRELSFYSHRIHVKIEGFRLDRLLDRALKAGLNLKSVRMVSSTELTCWLGLKDLKQLRKLAKSNYRITTIDERGPLPRTAGFLKRPALVLGCILALAIVIGQTFFVRAIEVNGYRGIPETALLECLEKQGIYIGACRSNIDWDDAEKAVYDTFPQVTWVQLVYSGRLVILNISETDHDIYDSSIQDYDPAETRTTYTDIIAAESGYIETIYPYYGTALVEEGDYVEKGQLLITGCVPLEPTTFEAEDELATEYFVNAEGEVWAKVPYRFTMNQERYLWGEGLADSENNSSEIIINKVEKTEKQAKRKTEQQIRLWAAENLPEKAEILNKSLKFSCSGNIIEVSVLLEVRQQIGTKQEELIGTKDTDTRDDRQD